MPNHTPSEVTKDLLFRPRVLLLVGRVAVSSIALALALVTIAGCQADNSRQQGSATGARAVDPLELQAISSVVNAQKAGEYTFAERMLDSMDVRFPNSARVQFLRGVQYESTGFQDLAIESYEQSRTMDELFPGAWHNLGSLYAMKHMYRKALEAFQGAVRLEPTSAAWHGVGSTYFELGVIDSAETALKESLALDADNVAARLALASIYAKSGDDEAAIAALQRCASAVFDSECAKEYAIQLIKNGSYSAAIDSLESVLEFREWDKQVHFSLAQALTAQGSSKEAAAARSRFEELDALDREMFRLRERIALNPESLRERLELADRYRLAGRPLDAARTLSAALVLAPGNLNIRNNLGLLLLNSAQAEAAAEQFKTILRSDSTHERARTNLARAEAMLAAEG